MKIDYAIVSTDDNNLYKDFWPIVKKLWYELIGIKPLLVEICDTNDILEYDDCIIHKIKKIEGINTGFQSQIARMYVTKFYPEKICITSDIDMLPLSKEYFTSTVENYDDDKLIIFSSDAYSNVDRYPICYNAAKGSTFDEIMKFESTFGEYCHKLHSLNNGWDTDELYFGKMVNTFLHQNKIIKLNRGWEHGRALNRIDRVFWVYDPLKLKRRDYIDSHSLRPYTLYKTEIDKLINFIL